MEEYAYFGLSRYIIQAGEEFLSSHSLGVSFKNLGSVVSTSSLSISCNKPSIVGVLLTPDEMEKIESKKNRIKEGVLKKIFVVSSEEEMIQFLSEDLGISMEVYSSGVAFEQESGDGVAEVVEERVAEVVIPAPVISSGVSVTAEVVETSPVVVENAPTIVEGTPVIAESVTTEKQESKTSYASFELIIENLKAENAFLLEKLSSDVHIGGIAVEENLTEELNVLKEENERLKKLVEQAKEKELLSSEKASSLENELLSLKSELETLRNKLTTNESVFKSDLSTLQSTNNTLKSMVDDLKGRLISKEAEISDITRTKGIIVREFDSSGIKFYVGASSMHYLQYYEHLLSNNDDILFVDLSFESYIDVIVRLENPIRVTKWLFEGLDINVVVSPYTRNPKIPMGERISLLTSPTYVMNNSIYSDCDWGKRLDEARAFGKQVVVFLGGISMNGVLDFLKAGNVDLRVLSNDSVLDRRNANLISRRYSKVTVEQTNIKRGVQDAEY